ncbi:hypothetical protein ABWED_3158 [Acinetobacter lwoffii]|nr:hypothetical protein ABVS_1455 [Acinetobacter lwoffii]UHT66382.1 hypothetical protein ABEDC_3235 [Acinetobacter lwoffii]UVB02383.1 hypothetical protein ABWED_3158 [Acinetobacter lwoffii]
MVISFCTVFVEIAMTDVDNLVRMATRFWSRSSFLNEQWNE